MNLNPFKHNPDLPSNQALINAIISLASQNTVETWRIFYKELLKSKLFLAQDPEAAPRPVLLVGKPDEVIMPLFTDVERLQRTYPDVTAYSAMPLSQLCNLAMQNGIHMININPENGPGVYLQRDEMQALANGKIPDIRVGDKSSWDEPNFIPMGNSKLPSEDILNKIAETASAFLEKQKGVEAGYIILLGSDEGESILTVALHFNETVLHNEQVAITELLVPAVEKIAQRTIGAKWLEGEQLQSVQSRVEPFYTNDAGE